MSKAVTFEDLTERQQDILALLGGETRVPLHATEVAFAADQAPAWALVGLFQLRDKSFVERIDGHTLGGGWKITAAGRNALAAAIRALGSAT